jgi:3-oxoacyl-[acyl-carrier-protein] synthase III
MANISTILRALLSELPDFRQRDFVASRFYAQNSVNSSSISTACSVQVLMAFGAKSDQVGVVIIALLAPQLLVV